jgi:two-component system OmpR family response regulator
MEHTRTYDEELAVLIQEFHERLESEAVRFLQLERTLAAVPSQASVTFAAIEFWAHRLSGTADSFGELEIGAASCGVEDAVIDVVKSGSPRSGVSLVVLRESLRVLCDLLTKSSAPGSDDPPSWLNSPLTDSDMRRSGRLRRVIYVDDDPHLRELVRMILSRDTGVIVRTVSSGWEAVREALRTRPDLILLDVIMPEIDGPATLVLLRSQRTLRSIPVVFVTASATQQEMMGLRALGVAGVISKPFDSGTLMTQVREIWAGVAVE